MEPYFIKFPQISYNNFLTRNITERVKIQEMTKFIPKNFYPYEVPENMRADQLAEKYYQDSTLDWLIYLVNNTIDPYYGWPLNQDEFDNYIVEKYGDLDYPQQAIAAWRTNWPGDDNNLTVAYYNSLPANIQKYYVPMSANTGKIIGYGRRQEDWIVSTNQIWTVNTNGFAYTNGEILISSSGGLDTGSMEVIESNTTVTITQHIQGNNLPGYTLRSRANGQVNAVISSTNTVLYNISLDEQKYWEPVFWYDVEVEANNNKKYIDLLESNFALETSEEIRRKLNA